MILIKNRKSKRITYISISARLMVRKSFLLQENITLSSLIQKLEFTKVEIDPSKSHLNQVLKGPFTTKAIEDLAK